jgi:hypothetical protein
MVDSTTETDEQHAMTRPEAIEFLDDRNGGIIVSEASARDVAASFDVELERKPSELQPISRLDRAQPDNDDLGIGVGSLCKAIADRLGLDAEDGGAMGHGRRQRERKKANLPKLKESAHE